MADSTPPTRSDWDDVVGDAVDRIAEAEANVAAARERQRPRSRAPLLAVGLVMLAAVAAWDVWYFTRPPEGLPVAVVAEDLRYSVQFVAELVEDFRAENGHLPTPADLGEQTTEEITYAVSGEAYTITASDGSATVTYHSSVPLATWVAGGEEPSP